ncbi:MAG: hypothetical protein JXR34_10430 [Bacteroidales bacterium]|nr:hypothetical protein [Bacteroidales bacterium]
MKTIHVFQSIILILFLFNFGSVEAQDSKVAKKNMLVVFYNVENLFDTIDDPTKNDNEFLPTGKKEWNTLKYKDKTEKLSLVLSSIDKRKNPDIIGLCEIENAVVIQDVISKNNLAKTPYKIVHFESPDRRSIDVALVYNSKKLQLLHQQKMRVALQNDANFKTRDILYVKLYHKSLKDTFNIFVNHWPSRSGGQEKSEHKRIAAAQQLKQITDSLFSKTNSPKIIIMGDFNDEPNNKSIQQILNALPTDTSISENQLYNTAYPLFDQHFGSYYYSREKKWNMLDQIILSGNLLSSNNKVVAWKNMQEIFQPEWILYTDKNGIKSPSRTYGGKYFGGYSDHLPVFIYFTLNRKSN